jgi:hypothetical protein
MNCNTDPEISVYEQLAKNSNNVFYLKKKEFVDVLEVVKNIIDSAPIMCKDFEQNTTNTLIIDSNLKDFIVTLTGSNPKIMIIDPKGTRYATKPILSLNEVQIVQVKSQMPGNWTIDTSTDGVGSIRASAISSVGFRFGFSTKKDMIKTNVGPKKGILKVYICEFDFYFSNCFYSYTRCLFKSYCSCHPNKNKNHRK